jgi:hypothetical protein
VALGLDRDDTIIRRRLRQKMEFISDDIAAQAPPTDAELNDFLKAHPDKFRVEQQFTFRQLYLNPAKHGANLASDAAQLLAKLKPPGGKADVPALGDAFMLDHDFTALPAGEIAKQFGQDFAAHLVRLKPGQWQGPVESGFGVHLAALTSGTFRSTSRFYQVLGELAHKKEQLQKLGDERGNTQIIQRLRAEMTQLAPVAKA